MTTGMFGVLAAHELVHGHNRSERLLGLVMLTAMSYRHFRVAHVFGHHRWAATDRDPASARLGESFHRFPPRTVFAHKIARDVLAMLILCAAVLVTLGGRSAAPFAAQSIIGIFVLELFN